MAINERELADLVNLRPTQKLDPFKGVKKLPLQEYFTSGHRTCQGCESALVMKMMVKAAGPRTIVLGSTGCMYVANTTYYSTSWVVPWMHTQLGSSGSAALGAAAALKVLMRKEGKKVGFVRVRWFRPFAAEELAKCLSRFKGVGIVDRDFSLGAPYSSGVLATEVRAALYPVANRPALIAFICGLGGREVTLPDVKKMTENVFAAAAGTPQPANQWIGLRE